MAYRSQLVIRTSDAHGAEVLERVKQLADSESKTISEKAIELLEAALDGPAPSDSAQMADDEPDEATDPPAAKMESAVRRDPAPALAPPSVKEKDPTVRPDEEPREAAVRCVELFDGEGAVAAAQALTAFFAAAEPVDGANIREELQERMNKSDYDDLMDALKETDEYREYRRRVVYASW